MTVKTTGCLLGATDSEHAQTSTENTIQGLNGNGFVNCDSCLPGLVLVPLELEAV